MGMRLPVKIDFPINHDVRGNLTALNENVEIPFSISRIYFLYDVPVGESRGGHAHKALEQVIIALSGSFDVSLDNGFTTETHRLESPNVGLYVSPMHWRELTNFSADSVCLVVASDIFDEADYIRDKDTFYDEVKKRND